MFCVVKAILRLVFFKILVMNFVSLPIYVNLAHFVFSVFFLSDLVLFSTGVNVFKSEVSYLLLYNICFIVLFFFSLFAAFKLYVSILLARYLTAASLCSWGWQESPGIIVLVVGGFLYILNEILFYSFKMVMSRKLISLLFSSSMVNFTAGIMLLSSLRKS